MKRTSEGASKVAAFFKKNIYFILMIVCVLAIGTMITVAAVNGSKDKVDDPVVNGGIDDDQDVDGDTDDDKDDDKDDEKQTFMLSGIMDNFTVDIGFSDTALVFNPTQNHWATHEGIDLLADAGSTVYCPFDGTVKSVNEDNFYGTTVVITHADGYETTYKLLKDVSVKQGTALKKGDKIGAVNENALAEIAQGAHLHLEVRKDGNTVDPAQYMQEGDK